MSKLIIGLTGGIGSGKTTITQHFSALGVDIVDADIIAREVVSVGTPALTAIKNFFGNDFLLDSGELNRPLLRSRIFSSEKDKQWLNNLLHPLIREAIITQTANATSPYCILVAPLLLENNLHELVDRVLVVDISEEKQLSRTLARDTSSKEEIKSIIASQVSRADRLLAADDIFDNENITISATEKYVLELDKKYLNLTKMV